jgi:hypothetical protein
MSEELVGQLDEGLLTVGPVDAHTMGGRIVVSSVAPTAAEAALLMKRGSTTPATAWPTALTVPLLDSETISSHAVTCSSLSFLRLRPAWTTSWLPMPGDTVAFR